jgi:hypothetical protein
MRAPINQSQLDGDGTENRLFVANFHQIQLKTVLPWSAHSGDIGLEDQLIILAWILWLKVVIPFQAHLIVRCFR